MAVLKSTACKSSYGRLTYIFNQAAHNDNKTSHRVLACSGTNIRMLHNPNGQLTTLQSGAYLEKQFRQSLKRAYNPKRKYQAQSIIISFDDQEFNTSNLNEQAAQALQLVQGYVYQHFSDTQSVSCVQCDGDGGRLHVHLLINTVKPNGKTVPTNRFSVYRMRKSWNEYLETHFRQVTGRKWKNPFAKQTPRQDIKDTPARSKWEEQLKQVINQIKQRVTNVTDFITQLNGQGIRVKERGKKRRWTYTQIVPDKHGKPKLKRVRAFYQRKDKAGHVLATRGLGEAYTKQGLEQYWQQQKEKEQELTPTLSRLGKGDKRNDTRKQDVRIKQEEVTRIEKRAQAARTALRRRRIQSDLWHQQAAEDQAWQLKSKSKSGSTVKGQSNQEGFRTSGPQSGGPNSSEDHFGHQPRPTKDLEGAAFGPDI